MTDNYFTELNNINVNDKVEKKNNLSYLSWAYAWGEVKKLHPNATYKVYEREDGRIYWDDGSTAWVKTGVTINDIEHIEYLPIMDYRNSSIPVAKITSFDVNKTIQRSLTKACARHGLGLYIYAGEDLPEEAKPEKPAFEKQATAEKRAATTALNKAKQSGDYQKPAPKGTPKERFETAMKWLESLKEWSPTAAQRDSLNNLCADLFDAGLEDEHNKLCDLIRQKDNLNDGVPY